MATFSGSLAQSQVYISEKTIWFLSNGGAFTHSTEKEKKIIFLKKIRNFVYSGDLQERSNTLFLIRSKTN